jgi:putative oxidoreductase
MTRQSGSIAPLIGRILISLIFILAGIAKVMSFSTELGYVAAAHLPFPRFSLGCGAAIEIFGGLCILTGLHTKVAAWIVFLFLIPTTLLFHNFWAMQGAARMDNEGHFLKNLAIMGGLLFLATHGAGAYSIDSARSPGS